MVEAGELGDAATERVEVICGWCGSADVARDAWAAWDAEAQAWVLGELFTTGWCNRCGGETRLEGRRSGTG